MQKIVILLRHAQARPLSDHGDVGRELTAAGLRQALKLGEELKSAGYGQIDELYVSHAQRAQQTAQQVLQSVAADEVHTDTAIYHYHPQAIFELIEHSRSQRVMIVGHEPTISECAAVMVRADKATAATLVAGVPTATALVFAVDVPAALSAQNAPQGQLIARLSSSPSAG